MAGLLICEADIYITIDADLQDDENAIISMVDHYIEGSQIVYGVRKSRDVDSFFKRVTAQLFYKFMQIMGVDSVYDHADYRLLSKEVVGKLKEYGEVNLFLRAIIPLIGFIFFVLSIIGAGYSFYHEINGNVVPGWTSTILPIFFFGGVNFLAIGILGEYIGKIYNEVKRRSRFIIEKELK